MAKAQTLKKSAYTKSDKDAVNDFEGSITNRKELFDRMIDNLYRKSVSIPRKTEISSRTLSMRFGSDY